MEQLLGGRGECALPFGRPLGLEEGHTALRAKRGTHWNKWMFRAPPACLPRFAELGTGEGQASLDQAADCAPGHQGRASPTSSWGPPSVLTVILCLSPQVCGASHTHLLRPRYGLKDPASRTPFGHLKVSEATLRVEKASQCLPPQPSLLGGPWAAEAPAFETEGCLPQNVFAKLTSSQPREAFPDLSDEAGPPNCPWTPHLKAQCF